MVVAGLTREACSTRTRGAGSRARGPAAATPRRRGLVLVVAALHLGRVEGAEDGQDRHGCAQDGSLLDDLTARGGGASMKNERDAAATTVAPSQSRSQQATLANLGFGFPSPLLEQLAFAKVG